MIKKSFAADVFADPACGRQDDGVGDEITVRTHVASSVVAERLPEMCGKATLATEVSRTSITVASITDTAISHGLKLGTHC